MRRFGATVTNPCSCLSLTFSTTQLSEAVSRLQSLSEGLNSPVHNVDSEWTASGSAASQEKRAGTEAQADAVATSVLRLFLTAQGRLRDLESRSFPLRWCGTGKEASSTGDFPGWSRAYGNKRVLIARSLEERQERQRQGRGRVKRSVCTVFVHNVHVCGDKYGQRNIGLHGACWVCWRRLV